MKRESPESRIIQHFSDENPEKIQLLFGIVKGIVNKRAPVKKKAKVKDTDPLGLKTHGTIVLGKSQPGHRVVVNSEAGS